MSLNSSDGKQYSIEIGDLIPQTLQLFKSMFCLLNEYRLVEIVI